MDKKLEELREKWLTLGGLKKIAIWIVGSWLVYGVLVGISFRDWPNQGLFGDMYGGLNSLFSGLAFAGVIITILLQSKELQEQRREFELQREATQGSEKALKLQAETLKASAKLDSVNALVNQWGEISSAIGHEINSTNTRLQRNLQAGFDQKEAKEKTDAETKELKETLNKLNRLRTNALIDYRTYLEI